MWLPSLPFLQAAQVRAMKAVIEKEELDCDFLVTRSFDVFFDEGQAAELKVWLKTQRADGQTWLQDMQWLEGPNLERVSLDSGAALQPYINITLCLYHRHKRGKGRNVFASSKPLALQVRHLTARSMS